jgi:hypothetical protein
MLRSRACSRSSGKYPRPDGEIGRRKRLKISQPQGYAGSIPAPGTNNINYLQNALIFEFLWENRCGSSKAPD